MKKELNEAQLIDHLGSEDKMKELVLSIFEENKHTEPFTNDIPFAFVGQVFETKDKEFLYMEATYEKAEKIFQLNLVFTTDNYDDILDRSNELKKIVENQGNKIEWHKL